LKQVRERIAQAELDAQAERDGKLAEFDKKVSAPLAAKKAAAQAEQKAREDALLAEQAAKFDKQHKQPRLDKWLRSGGSREEFEHQWPSIRAQVLEGQTTGDREREQWRRQAARRYR
jgi:hypothetical protein